MSKRQLWSKLCWYASNCGRYTVIGFEIACCFHIPLLSFSINSYQRVVLWRCRHWFEIWFRAVCLHSLGEVLISDYRNVELHLFLQSCGFDVVSICICLLFFIVRTDAVYNISVRCVLLSTLVDFYVNGLPPFIILLVLLMLIMW